MTLRVKIQQGRRVEYRPGWDCHGLPIELKALAAAGKEDAGADLSPVGIRRIARDLASHTVLDQMSEFRSFGVMADWDGRWTTMDPAYELRQLRLFQTLVQRGLIYRRYKPVYWSPSSHTALAEAELEYNENHISTAAYVKFPLHVPEGRALPASLSQLAAGPSALSFVIWTTTPWTLPANEAIAVHRDFDYAVIRLGESPDLMIIAESCLEAFTATCCSAEDDGAPRPTVVARSIRGDDLLGLNYTNPLRGRSAKPQPIIHADFVTAGSGSGLVHIAPGHGFDDYTVCMGLGLPVPAPVDGQGRFTAEAYPDDPARLAGLSVQGEGGAAVLALLGDGAVIKTHKYRHKYPYDWRTKKPIIVRATAQWFADVALIKKPAVASLQSVQFVPETGRSRLESFVNGRSEWCISRQRAWGMPIPALYGDDGSVVLTEATVEHILGVVQERGTDAWWSDAADEPAWVPESLRQANPGVRYARGTDTMDVWFDSGSSWTQSPVDGSEGEGAAPAQADVYLEGSDQHRGWFQSSLLTRVAALGRGSSDNASALSPFKTLVTHGFMLDGEGKKMSKSLGNIVTGAQVMDGTLLPPVKERKRRKNKGEAAPPPPPPKPAGALTYDALGPDALRLWVAGSDYTGDVVMSESVLQSTHTALVKYRVILKMLLGSMQSEAAARQSPVTVLDRIALLQLQDTMAEVGAAYDRFEFYRGVAALNRWVTNDLSAFYLEAAKDRLYCADGGGVLEPIFLGLARMLAPVVPMLVAEAWDHAPAWLQQSHAHPLRQLYSDPIVDAARLAGPSVLSGSAPTDARLRRALPAISAAHAAVKAGLERARNDKVVGSSLQCSVTLRVSDAPTRATLQEHAASLDAMFVVSSVEVTDGASTEAEVGPGGDAAWEYVASFEGGEAVVRPPKKGKCGRCWRYVAEPEEELCGRCADVVAQV